MAERFRALREVILAISDSGSPTLLGVEGPLGGPQPQERYGDYEVIKPLASGGMADIFLARKLGVQGFQKLVVIKRIRRELGKEDHLINLFIDEAHIAAKLDHPNVVVISDLGEVEDSYFMAMEYLRGQTLRALQLRVAAFGQLLPPAMWIRIMEYALDGLHYAHELCNDDGNLLGLVHRDFTPSNIMVTYSGTVKVIDFGVAHVEGPTRHETRIGTLKGKIAYLSPEQCRGTQVVDRRTDIFAAGILLWEFLSGRQLFDGPSDTAIILEIIQGVIPPPLWGGNRVDPALEAIVMKALDREPAQRYQTAAEMRDALRGYLRNQASRTDASDIASMMTLYFDNERVADERLIGKSDTGARNMPGYKSESQRSGPGSRPRGEAAIREQVTNPSFSRPPPPPPRKLAPLIVFGCAIGLLSSVGVWQFMKPGRVVPPPQRPAEPPKNEPKIETAPTNPPKTETVPANPPKSETVPTNPPKSEAVPTHPSHEDPPETPSRPKHTTPSEIVSASGFGLLDFDTRPYTEVFIGKKKVGETPMLGVKVPAGQLTLTLINEEAGIRETYTITVPKDGHVTKKLKL